MPVLVRCSKGKKSQTSVFLKNNTASFPSGGEMFWPSSLLFLFMGRTCEWVCLYVCLVSSFLISPWEMLDLWNTLSFWEQNPSQVNALGTCIYLFYLILGCVEGWWQLGSIKKKKSNNRTRSVFVSTLFLKRQMIFEIVVVKTWFIYLTTVCLF